LIFAGIWGYEAGVEMGGERKVCRLMVRWRRMRGEGLNKEFSFYFLSSSKYLMG
jgi:hypothetical protein